jgi:hypothetical protein
LWKFNANGAGVAFGRRRPLITLFFRGGRREHIAAIFLYLES